MTASGLVRIFAILLLVGCLSGAGATQRRPLAQDAYIWQRHWTPAVDNSVARAADLVAGWRVLAADADERGHLLGVTPDWPALAASGRPVTAVIRIDGQLVQWDEDALLAEIDAVLARWRGDAHAVPLAGLEIDHDCATARLPAYAAFLARLRGHLLPAMRLSVTALPTWLGARDLAAIIAATDEMVLQVHAVQNPRRGLFDPGEARRWANALSRRTTKPFRIALPAYGTRIVWRDDGSILAVESEMPRLAGGHAASELTVAPQQVAGLLRDLEADPPPHLAGATWFRLPVDGDARGWSFSTWRAVLRGLPLQSAVVAVARDSAAPGASDLVLVNDGDIDADLPRAVTLPAGCAVADGVNGYALDEDPAALIIRRRHAGHLAGHRQQVIGWMRCRPKPEELHVAE